MDQDLHLDLKDTMEIIIFFKERIDIKQTNKDISCQHQGWTLNNSNILISNFRVCQMEEHKTHNFSSNSVERIIIQKLEMALLKKCKLLIMENKLDQDH